MSKWMPIETAPKDGSGFLAFVSNTWIEGMFWNGADWSYLSDGDCTTNCRYQPTHWMPLPTEPSKDDLWNNIHTCSYSCERPACIKAQRDELAAAAAQGAVGEVSEWEGSLCVQWVPNYEPPVGTKLYAAPPAAAPIDGAWDAIVRHCVVSEAVTPNPTDPYSTIGALIDYHVAMVSTPAAPGIDLKQFRVSLTYAADVLRNVGNVNDSRVAARLENLLALIAASPKGDD